ncbi:MAG TPA: phosphopyruvate hydratase [Pyrodictium sp.]|nr:phosphopyruvate hydratase [Pyrodictium sp.]
MQEFLISDVHARMVLDSRGRPTVEVEVRTRGGGFGRAIAPAGASKGKHEALELRDGGREFRGYGVRKAVENVNKIIRPKLIGLDSRNQKEIDYLLCELDGTPNKSRLGANAIVATSLAVAKAAASTAHLPLYRYLGGPSAYLMPVPMLNVINGGVHAGNELAFQEFMIVPVGADRFSEALRIAVEVYYELKNVLKERYGTLAINVGDEGGFAPPMKTSREALDALVRAISGAGYSESEVVLALDAAASQIYKDGKYHVDGMKLDADDLLEYYLQLISEYPIKSIEDPFMEEDFEHFRLLTEKVRGKVLVVGDDLYTTNPQRLRKGIELKATTAVLVKVNQIGTLTETLQVVDMAHKAGMRTIISHRSGETEDTTIAHLAVAVRSGLIKTGAPARGERTAKYNELLRIEEELGSQAEYPGIDVFRIASV